ncbi:unnamed protein product [Rotaria sordida]|uniref:CCHC-type domain-containing protein n=1 Tax=Rotaria sordida TaxID=392033 RepID=A0A818V9V6_9BILA|nr:unnamed protein product [Rotaria sordida]CAF3712020.1 unnamed protein product [Rotaria sordida]CAF3828946.1 unnamed protein product [Rotaria sordida]
MIEESWDDDETPKPSFQQQPTVEKLGIGRGKLPFPANNIESAPVSKWNSDAGGSSTSVVLIIFAIITMKINQNNNDTKPTFTGWRGSAAANNNNDSDDTVKRTTFGNSNTRGSFTNSAGGFRGGRGGSSAGGGDRGGSGAGDRENRNSGNCYNCNQSGHRSRDYPEPKKTSWYVCGGVNPFFGSGRKPEKVSADIFDQRNGRADAQPVKRYVPPPLPTSEADIFGKAVSKGENFDKVKPIELYEKANFGTQILSNICRVHFDEPTTIQRYAIPCIRQ